MEYREQGSFESFANSAISYLGVCLITMLPLVSTSDDSGDELILWMKG